MKAYVGQTRSKKLTRRLLELGIGECTLPKEWPPRRLPYFLDNGAFPAWTAGEEWDEPSFTETVRLSRAVGGRYLPDFVVAPDVVAGGAESLARSREWIGRLAGLPAYLAVQDGMVPDPGLPAGFAGIFVGGTIEWKLATGGAWVELAHGLGLPCHVGRVGTAKRVRWAIEIGADSIDSSLPLFAERNLLPFLNALGHGAQAQLWGPHGS